MDDRRARRSQREPHRWVPGDVRDSNLEWTPEIEQKIADGDKQGTGYKTTRVRADLRHAWKSRLDDAQIDKIEEVLQQFRL